MRVLSRQKRRCYTGRTFFDGFPLDFSKLTLASALRGLKKKDFSSTEILTYFVKQCEADRSRPDSLNAVIGLHGEAAATAVPSVKPDSLLAGLPVLIKDNMNMEGLPVTCSSRILEGYVSPYTGGALENLTRHGGLIYGRTNMDEFAMGSSSETSVYGPTRNPVNRDYIPGGSSGGAAAAVAGGLGLAALGSDTGGSIRQPAACCGVVGLKPTYGRVSRYGLVAFGSSLDQIGPIAKTVEDSAILLQAIAGHDHRDSTSSTQKVPDYVKSLEESPKDFLKGKKVGLPKEYFTEHLAPEIAKRLNEVTEFYKKSGCELVPVSLPSSEYGIGCYYIIATAEASANLARFDGIRYGRRSKNAKDLKEVYFKSRSEGFGLEVKRRILLGTYVLSSGYYEAYYLKAMKVRRVIKNDFDEALKKVDFILTPMMPDPVFKIGEKSADPIKMYLSDIYTVSLNLAGVPGISVPCGLDSRGLPIGFQLVAGHFQEEKLLQAAHAYDREVNGMKS